MMNMSMQNQMPKSYTHFNFQISIYHAKLFMQSCYRNFYLKCKNSTRLLYYMVKIQPLSKWWIQYPRLVGTIFKNYKFIIIIII